MDTSHYLSTKEVFLLPTLPHPPVLPHLSSYYSLFPFQASQFIPSSLSALLWFTHVAFNLTPQREQVSRTDNTQMLYWGWGI